jgi:uncharacterized protein (TIGR02687 family)
MSDVSKRLKELFVQHNIIFWYDESGNLRDEFESLDLNIEKLTIDNNQFNIKYQILTGNKDAKYLIYSDDNEPKYEDNWLLDLQLKSHMFSADRASMILNDLSIDIIYKPFIQNHIKFFEAKSRVEAFSKLIDENDDDQQLAIKMLASIAKCDPKITDITKKLLINDKTYKDICKFSLENYLWNNIKTKYNYDVEAPTFKDFGFKLLQNHMYSFLDKSKCELNKEAVLVVKNWMDSNKDNKSFKQLSLSVQEELSIGSTLNEYKFEDIVNCDTYELCEQLILSNISKMINSDNFDKEKILEICNVREHTFWYDGYENIYKAFKSAIKLIDCIKKVNLEINEFDEGIERYSSILSKIDYYYRKYINHSNNSEHSQILKTLNEKCENIYLNDYLRVLNNSWQSNIKQYKESKIDYQKSFYDTNVKPIVDKGQKVFVIISDALRYECGVELKNKIMGLNRYNADIKPMVGILPSFTQLGVASLLPNELLSFQGKDDTVYINGKSSKGTANRDKILKNIDEQSVYIDSESFLDFNRIDGREFSKAHQIMYIYHNEIDSTGDKASSEHKVFDAVEDSFITIEKIIKQISNMNGANIFITSDHGFLYQDQPTADSEFCKVEKTDDTKKFNRRFVISPTIDKNNALDIYNASDLNIDGTEKIALAKSINKIRLKGGGHRFVHGGATLQEMVIPLITVKKKRKDDVRDVEVSCTPINQITTNSVVISFYQEEIVSDKIKPIALKIALFASDKKLLSNFQSYTFDSIDTYDRNREVKLKFDLKQNAGNYSGQNIKLVVKKIFEDSSEEVSYKEYDIKLQLSFVNDFDDF